MQISFIVNEMSFISNFFATYTSNVNCHNSLTSRGRSAWMPPPTFAIREKFSLTTHI